MRSRADATSMPLAIVVLTAAALLLRGEVAKVTRHSSSRSWP